MHEASIAGGIVQLVEDSARREHFASVTAIRLSVGTLAGIDVRALRFSLEAIAPGTLLAAADIIIEEPPGQAWCMMCAQTVVIAQRGEPCPQCDSFQLQVTGGQELQVIDLQVKDSPHAPVSPSTQTENV